MKREKIFFLVLASLVLFSMAFIGCEQATDSGGTPEPTTPAPTAVTTGTLTINNNATTTTDTIVKTVITVTGETTPKETYSSPIKNGESKSFTLDAGGYTIVVTDNYDYTYTATVSISAGGTKTLSYNGNSLKE